MILAPTLSFGLLESGLRLIGYGYPTTFFIEQARTSGVTIAIENREFGKPGVAVLDPNAKKPTVLLRVALPESLRDKPPPDLPAQFFPNLVELTVGPPGSLP